MIISIRKRTNWVVTFLLCVFFQTYTTEVYALTSGPAQEEYASFEPIGTTDMVNLYTGDFTYNIPLLSVPGPNGGYPINLAYHSGVGMDQEASWVGLGWNVNVGAVNRNLRGIPDDFDGDKVIHEQHIRESWTVGLNLFTTSYENFGSEVGDGAAKPTLQIYYNNYKGLGYRVRYSPSASAGGVTLGVSMSYDPHEGFGLSPSLGISAQYSEYGSVSLGVSGQWNSRQGFQGFSVSGSVSSSYGKTTEKTVETTKKVWLSPSNEYANIPTMTTITEKKAISFSTGSGGVSFNFNQGVPAVTMPMDNSMFTTELKLGFSADNLIGPAQFRSNFPLAWSGEESFSKVRGNGIVESAAYGYMNTEKGNSNPYALLDFSPSHVGYNNKLPFVAPSNITNDVFSITGQGISGVFRGHRSDIGVWAPRKVESYTEQNRLSVDVGVATVPTYSPSCGFGYHLGIGAIPSVIGIATSTTGNWSSGNLLGLAFKEANPNANYEGKYFKDMGDRPAFFNTSMYDAWQQDEAVLPLLGSGSDLSVYTPSIGGVNLSASNSKFREQRQVRSRVIQTLSKKEATQYGFNKGYKYDNVTSKFNTYAKDHHTSEISILEPDGMRYIYGLPAYNITQEDAAFSVQKNPSDEVNFITGVPVTSNGTPTYDKPNGDWSKKPEFLDKKTLPSYAHSWMLTAVVSADYVDLTNDGPSDDDLGYWVEFKYNHGEGRTKNDIYTWRAPYQGASYMPGTNQDFDDKASYTKGKKELYYLAEVRTKTHIAVYETELRDDALAASNDANGGKPSSVTPADRMALLRRIRLYTRREYTRIKTGAGQIGTPLKTVHFEYMHDNPSTQNLELCQGVPNHIDYSNSNKERGKLTLRKVYFTYENSTKGALSPYVFSYSEKNPDYSLTSNDCWGNYQDNSTISNYPYSRFPYTNQTVNTFADAWNLTRIDLPTGGTMNIEYEQHDYAYVEDKKAMQFYDIVGTGLTGGDINRQRGTAPLAKAWLTNDNHRNTTSDPIFNDYQYRVYFPLKTPVPIDNADRLYDSYDNYVGNVKIYEWFKDHYIGDTKDLYFKTAVNLLLPGNATDEEAVDFVEGYAEIRVNTVEEDYGVAQSQSMSGSSNYDLGYITVEPSHIKGFGAAGYVIHPFRDAAFQHLKFNRPELIYGGRTASGIASLFSSIPDILTSLAGYKHAYSLQGWSSDIFLNGFSQMRLLTPDGKKLGGGVRVKKLSINDDWNEMTKLNGSSNYQDSEYGQIYDYSIEEKGVSISSGVAYEPFSGKEQSPLVFPAKYKYSNLLQAPNNLFIEHPIMMQHYPSSTIGYRKVTVKSISTEHGADAQRSTTPYSEYEFYTPKEFPIIMNATGTEKEGANHRIIPIPGIYTEYQKHEAISQGYALIFNDMAGKPKSITQRTKPDPLTGYEGVIVSKQEYEYFTNDNGELDNKVDVFTDDGVYQKAILGVDYDINVEMSENWEESTNFALDFNFEGGVIHTAPVDGFCIPLPIPTSGGISFTVSSLRTAVVQKIINKKGILKSTTITTLNSAIKTENLVFDAVTSEPLLTKTTNEFKDDIYNYTQKARWHYNGMAEAYKNIGTSLTGVYLLDANNDKGVYNISYSNNFTEFPFTEGDEVFIEVNSTTTTPAKTITATVYTIGIANKKIGLVDVNGVFVNEPFFNKITITRSGRRNLLYTSVGGIVAMDMSSTSNGFEPAIVNGGTKTLEPSKVINASAVKFRDYWPSAKECDFISTCPDATFCLKPISGVTPTNFEDKMATGEIEIFYDGRPLSSANITIGKEPCLPNHNYEKICVNTTATDYRVEVVYPNGTIDVNPDYFETGAICSYTLPSQTPGEATLPCKIYQTGKNGQNGQNLPAGDRVEVTNNGVVTSNWPMNQISNVPNSTCYYARGEWEFKNPNGNTWGGGYSNASGNPKLNFDCMFNQFPHDIAYIRCRFLWSNQNVNVNTSWEPGFTGSLYNTSEMAAYLRTWSGKNWQTNQNGYLYADMSIAEADDLKANAHFAIKAYLAGINTPPYGPFLWDYCFLGYPGNNTPGEIWYSFKYQPKANNSLRITGLQPGTNTIKYFSGTDEINSVTVVTTSGPTIQAKEIAVQLPLLTGPYIVNIYDGTNLVNTKTYNYQPPPTINSGVQISFPVGGVGNHLLEVYSNDKKVEHETFSCDQSDASESVLACSSARVPEYQTPNYNYYRTGTKGNWRPWAAYTYVTERDYTSTKGIREKGLFKDFTPFSWTGNNSDKWQWGALATKYSPHSYELENVDAIGNFSAATYGYSDNLPTAVAKNARYNEIVFEDFEQYPKQCNDHWDLFPNDKDHKINQGYLSSSQAHSGKTSYKIGVDKTINFNPVPMGGNDEEKCATALSTAPYNYNYLAVLEYLTEGKEPPLGSNTIPTIMRTTNRLPEDDLVEILPTACNCLGKFAPTPGKKYHLSAWMKRGLEASNIMNYSGAFLKIVFKDASGNVLNNSEEILLQPEGPMIEGWQQLKGDFTIPADAIQMQVSVINTPFSTQEQVDLFLDDLRIQPYNASMMTYVYDQSKLRITAQLDDNNFATFYVYDQEGKLIKTKKETTEGIKTINEGRQHIRTK